MILSPVGLSFIRSETTNSVAVALLIIFLSVICVAIVGFYDAGAHGFIVGIPYILLLLSTLVRFKAKVGSGQNGSTTKLVGLREWGYAIILLSLILIFVVLDIVGD